MSFSFTWQQFLVAASVLTLAWWAGVILVCYRDEARKMFRAKETARPLAKAPEQAAPAEPDDGLLGPVKLPEGLRQLPMDGFGFTGKETQIGLIPDVLEDLKALFRRLAQSDGQKPDFFRMMTAITEDYPELASHPRLPDVLDHIRTHAPFQLSAEELNTLW